MYPSDYGYATDFTKCTENLYGYYEEACKGNDWLYNSANQWLLTPYSEAPFGAFLISLYGYASPDYNGDGEVNDRDFRENHIGVRPALYLSPEAVIESGDGSQSNPYKLGA